MKFSLEIALKLSTEYTAPGAKINVLAPSPPTRVTEFTPQALHGDRAQPLRPLFGSFLQVLSANYCFERAVQLLLKKFSFSSAAEPSTSQFGGCGTFGALDVLFLQSGLH